MIVVWIRAAILVIPRASYVLITRVDRKLRAAAEPVGRSKNYISLIVTGFFECLPTMLDVSVGA